MKTTQTRKASGVALAQQIDEFQQSGRTMFRVPSSDGRRVYIVDASTRHPHCTCADFAYRRLVCKHIHAARAARGDVAYAE